MMRKCGILAISSHPRMRREGDEMVKMMYFLVNMVDSSFETSHSASKSTNKGRAMLDRSEIDGDGEQL